MFLGEIYSVQRQISWCAGQYAQADIPVCLMCMDKFHLGWEHGNFFYYFLCKQECSGNKEKLKKLSFLTLSLHNSLNPGSRVGLSFSAQRPIMKGTIFFVAKRAFPNILEAAGLNFFWYPRPKFPSVTLYFLC